MPRSPSGPTVLRVDGPVVIEWPDGTRIQLGPAGLVQTAGRTATPTAERGRPGRKPSPATVKLIDAMRADTAGGKSRSRQAYLTILRDAGGPKSDNAAGIIVNREAKRAFGHPLGRSKQPRSGRAAGRRGGGRRPSTATTLLRAKLAKDKAAAELRDPSHYVRWVVDQPGVKLGLKQARPVVYRELRAAKGA